MLAYIPPSGMEVGMTEVSTVLDATGGIAPGKGESALIAQAGKPYLPFLAVLHARMAGPVQGELPARHAAGLVAASAENPGRRLDADADSTDGMPALSAATTDAYGGPAGLAAMSIVQPPPAFVPVPQAGTAGLPAQAPAVVVPAAPAGLQTTPTPAAAALPAELAPADGRPELAKTAAEGLRHPPEPPPRTANPAVETAGRGQTLPPVAAFAPPAQEAVAEVPAATLAAAPGQNASGPVSANPQASDGIPARLPEMQQARGIDHRLNLAIEAPARSPAFASEFGEKIVWLAGRHAQFAELSLNPPHLGALEVRLSVSGGEAGAQFFSANPAVREALEAALPRLRELMAQAGLHLGQALVRDEAFNRAQEEAGGHARAAAAEPVPSPAQAPAHALPIRGMGLVDLYV